MRDQDCTVVYTFKNAAGNDVVLKKECPDNTVHIAYQELVALAAKILEGEASANES